MTKNANRKKYHYIYKTTCLITGKYYLGMHSTDNLEDGYMGSGKRLWYSINKHGKENHVCEILEHYFTREWLREREAELVNEDTLVDPMCMNLKVGGEGGWDHVIADGNKQGRMNLMIHGKPENGQSALRKKKELDPDFKKYMLDLNSKNLEKGRNTILKRYGVKSYCSIINGDRSITEKRIKKYSEIGHQKGSNNSQFGTCWITDGISNRKIRNFVTVLQESWFYGRSKTNEVLSRLWLNG